MTTMTERKLTTQKAIAEAIAQDAIAVQGSGQTGWILVRGELWRAQAREGSAPVAKGDRVRIVDTHERVLVVEAPA